MILSFFSAKIIIFILSEKQTDQCLLLAIKKIQCHSKFKGLNFWRRSHMTRFALLKLNAPSYSDLNINYFYFDRSKNNYFHSFESENKLFYFIYYNYSYP